MKVKFIAFFQEFRIASMSERTWSENLDVEIELPYDFSARKLRATIEGTDDKFLQEYETTFKSNMINLYSNKYLFINAIPSQFKNAIRVIAEFKIYHDVQKLVLWNYYGNKNYGDSCFFIEKASDLKSITVSEEI